MSAYSEVPGDNQPHGHGQSLDGNGLAADISFAGCGFNGVYHVGAVACLTSYAPRLLQQRVLGSSAGALAGAAILGEVPLDIMTKNIINLVTMATSKSLGPFCPSFNMHQELKEGLEKMLPDDIHIRASGRLFISMTKFPSGSNLLVSDFKSKADLLDALAASSFVPTLSGWSVPRFRGELVWDGGYSDNLPVFDSQTVTVSPFAGDASICPKDGCKIGNLLNLKVPHNKAGKGPSFNVSLENTSKFLTAVMPPGKEGLLALCEQGYGDAMRFLTENNLIRCDSCSVVQDLPTTICDMCEVIREEAASKTLPLEIRMVFEECSKVPRHILSKLYQFSQLPGFVVRSLRSISVRPNLDCEDTLCPFSYLGQTPYSSMCCL